MSWQSFEKVGLRLETVPEELLGSPLSDHQDWLNQGGALQRVADPDHLADTDNAILVVHSTRRAITVLWASSPRYIWGDTRNRTPYQRFKDLGWSGTPHARYVRVPTPTWASEALPEYI